MLGVVTAILVVGALAVAQTVFAPLACALLIIALVWPLQARLQRRLPKFAALAISMLVTIAVLVAFGWIVAWAFSRVGHYLVADTARFQSLYTRFDGWLEEHDIVVASLWAEHFNVGWLLGAFQQLASRVNGMLSFSIVVLIYVILGLLEVDVIAAALRRMRNGAAAGVMLVGGTRTAAKLRRYMLVRTAMSVITGILVWAFILLCGLPLAQEWGVMAFALNYIPFIGSLVATVLPALFSAAQFDAWQNAIPVFVCLQSIQFLVGSYLEPRIAGSVLSISPFMVLFSVFFWTYLWGLFGAFIGVPIVIAVLTLCEQSPSSRWVAELFGAPAAVGE
jgi:predicted PurR-regulated permease PerM